MSKCLTCKKTLKSNSRFLECTKCRRNKKCHSCNKPIGITKTGFCKKCVGKVRSKNNGRGNEKNLDPKDFLEYSNLIFHIENIDYKIFSKKWASRTLYKESPVLWKNIYWYTKRYKNINIQERIKRILLGADFAPVRQGFDSEYVIMSKGPVQGYISIFNQHNITSTKYKVGSLQFYQEKYGFKKGREKYTERYKKLLSRQSKPYSKISKELFDMLNPEGLYAENEYRVTLSQSEQDKLRQMVMFLDYTLGNKVIEFDGTYWHRNDKKDKYRDEILTNRGYKVLRIKEEDYKQNKRKVVNKCLKFLESL